MPRKFFLLPIIALMVAFTAPQRVLSATTVTPPANLCQSGKWVSCGNNNFYCTALKGDNCTTPSWYGRANYGQENWSQKQASATKVGTGVTMQSSPTKYVYKYIRKKICTTKNHKRTCAYKRVLTKVLK